MAFNRPSLSQLVSTAEAEINALIPGADARMRFSIFNVFTRVWAALVDGLYSALIFLSRQLFFTTATSDYLTQLADSEGIQRIAARAAQGTAIFTGTAGSAIIVGTLVQRADGVQYQTTAGGIVPIAGSIEIACIALSQGTIGNAASGVALQAVSPIAGISNIIVSASQIGGGADEETDDQLRARGLYLRRNPPGVGTVADWQRWAFSFSSSVTRVWVVPTPLGNNSVAVVFAQDGAGIVPPPSVIAQMQAHLKQFEPAGVDVRVYAPTVKSIGFTIHEVPTADPAVREAITNELADLLYREAGPGSTLPISHINEAISAARGEIDHTLVAPANALFFMAAVPSATLAVFEIGALGTINWI
jgi:uncharacterized phage protein gp47/JayE